MARRSVRIRTLALLGFALALLAQVPPVSDVAFSRVPPPVLDDSFDDEGTPFEEPEVISTPPKPAPRGAGDGTADSATQPSGKAQEPRSVGTPSFLAWLERVFSLLRTRF